MGIHVVGGTYRETCLEPHLDRLLGSGLRAAAILTSRHETVTLTTAVAATEQRELAAVAATYRVPVRLQPRPDPVEFHYMTPVHATTRPPATAQPRLTIEADRVLAFGMPEAEWTVTADRVVIDPQHDDVTELLARVEASQVALVLNEHEARAKTKTNDLTAAGRALLSDTVRTVVIKQGAVGGVIVRAGGTESFGPYRTELVNPIGSGDAFTAGFASAWLSHTNASDAANLGSRFAAAHSLTGTPSLTDDSLDTLAAPLKHPGQDRPTVYLAGPFFTLAQRTLVHAARTALLNLGAQVFSPFHDVGPGGDEVAGRDLSGLATADSVFALLDGGDPGTLFETGWATRNAIPVVGFTSRPDSHDWTMLRGTSARVDDDFATALYHAVWAALDPTSP